MESLWCNALWQQFGAAIDTVGIALLACPDTLWNERLWRNSSTPPVPVEFSEFWNIAFHTLFWLDLYLSGSLEGFAPPSPFTLEDPDRAYTKGELQAYLVYTRTKCRKAIAELTEEKAGRLCTFPWLPGKTFSFLELQLYNMRHVQEHASQLHLFLGQHGHAVSSWIDRARDAGTASER
jgi:DinB superfamily